MLAASTAFGQSVQGKRRVSGACGGAGNGRLPPGRPTWIDGALIRIPRNCKHVRCISSVSGITTAFVGAGARPHSAPEQRSQLRPRLSRIGGLLHAPSRRAGNKMSALAPAAAAGNRTCAGASTSYAQAPAAPQRRWSGASRGCGAQQQQRCALIASGRRDAAAAAAARRRPAAAAAASFGSGEIVEVKDLKGIRVLKNEDDTPRVEYLVEWKDGSPDTWCAAGCWLLGVRKAGAGAALWSRLCCSALLTAGGLCWAAADSHLCMHDSHVCAGSRAATWPTTCCATTSSAGGAPSRRCAAVRWLPQLGAPRRCNSTQRRCWARLPAPAVAACDGPRSTPRADEQASSQMAPTCARSPASRASTRPQGDEETVTRMMEVGGDVLARTGARHCAPAARRGAARAELGSAGLLSRALGWRAEAARRWRAAAAALVLHSRPPPPYPACPAAVPPIHRRSGREPAQRGALCGGHGQGGAGGAPAARGRRGRPGGPRG